MDRFEAMRAFVTVADQRGFAAAARKLALSTSAVTRLIAGLEEHLSIKLLHRTTRTVSLTDGGARYLVRARHILRDLEEAEANAAAERAQPSGRFVVAASRIFGRRNVVPLFSEFLRRYPSVVGELTLGDRNINLVEDGVDLAVRIGALRDSSLIAKRVGATRRVVVTSPAYLSGRKKPRTPEELAEHLIVHSTAVQSANEWHFVREEKTFSVALTPVFTTNSADAAIRHVELGGGITSVLGYQVANAVKAGKLIVLLQKFETSPLPIQLVYPSSRLLSANVRAFVELTTSTRDWNFT